MGRKNFNKRKNSKVVRDLYDGKIISDEVAISTRNLSIIALKEGYIIESDEE